MLSRNTATLTIALATCLLGGPGWAQQDAATPQPILPPGFSVDFSQAFLTESGDSELIGPVTISWGDSRLQADYMSLRGTRIEARGNVLVVWQGNRIFGNRGTYDLETERGIFEDIQGQVQSDYLFWAETAEKVGDNVVHLTRARVTTCTQPNPEWDFAVSSATITINQYARMWNVRFHASRMPLIYFPYLIWPVKKDRAAGLLFPEFNSTRNRGQAVTQQLFIPLGQSADLTLLGRYYSEAGLGGGGELRMIPNSRGAATFGGFYIDDKVAEDSRYRATFRQTQSLNSGFRLVADLNFVSDFNYNSDFERDLEIVSSPTILARLELSRNGPWTSVNIRGLRREQLFASVVGQPEQTLVQKTLPEIEWRGRSRRLGRTPLYLTYEASAAAITQFGRQQGSDIDADYLRGDIFPALSMPLSRFPWIEITPQVSYRVTQYTQRQELLAIPIPPTSRPGDRASSGNELVIVDRDLTRSLVGAALDIIGPKIVKIYDRPKNPFSAQYKHLIETRINYGYQDVSDFTDEIVLYDEVDRFSGAGQQLSYGITQRLFAKRPQSQARDLPEEPQVVLPDATTSGDLTAQPVAGEFIEEEELPEIDTTAKREPVEIATIELRQSRSFDRDLSFADLDGDNVNEARSSASDIQLIGRFNPSPRVSLDLRSNYHVLYDEIGSVNVSGSVQSALARLRFSVFHSNGLTANSIDDTQLRLTAGLKMFDGRLQLDVDGSLDVDPLPGNKYVPDKRLRLQYSTQCCSVLVEHLDRDFVDLSERRDFFIRVDLKGIGKIFDVNY